MMDGLAIQELLQLILNTDTYSSRLTQYQPPVTQLGSNHFANSSKEYQVHDFYLLHYTVHYTENLCPISSKIIDGSGISTHVLDVVLWQGPCNAACSSCELILGIQPYIYVELFIPEQRMSSTCAELGKIVSTFRDGINFINPKLPSLLCTLWV